jgi:hypothetical protein
VNSKAQYTALGSDGVLYAYGETVLGSLYRTTDDGKTWQICMPFWGGPGVQVFDTNRIITGIGNLAIHAFGAYRSISDRFYWFSDRVISFTKTGKIVFAGTMQYDSIISIYRTADDGATWDSINAMTGVCYSMLQGRNSLILSTSNGLFRSLDEGETWVAVNVSGQYKNVSAQCDRLLATVDYWPLKWVSSADGGVTWDTLPAHEEATSYFRSCDRLYEFDGDGVSYYDTDSNIWRLRSEGLRGFVPTQIELDSSGAIWLGCSSRGEVPRWYVGRSYSDWWQPVKSVPGITSVLSGQSGMMFGIADKIYSFTGDDWKTSYGLTGHNPRRLRYYYGRVYALYDNWVGMSASNGSSWTEFPGYGSSIHNRDICVLPNGDLYLLRDRDIVATSNGTDWRTIYQGSFWDQTSLTYDTMRRHLYLLNGGLKQSSDDGKTWIEHNAFDRVTREPIFAPDGRIFINTAEGNLTSNDGVNFELEKDTVLGKGIPSFHDGYVYVARGNELFRSIYKRQLQVSPNQVDPDDLQIIDGQLELSTPQRISVAVYDIRGALLESRYDQLLSRGRYDIRPSFTSPGVYIVAITGERLVKTVKFVVN